MEEERRDRLPSVIDEEEDGSRRPSIVYEEELPVVVRRRGVKMTVRIFGVEDDDSGEEGKSRNLRSNSLCGQELGVLGTLTREARQRNYKSVGSLEDMRKNSPSVRVSPCSSLSPTSPDNQALIRAESPTKGIGRFHKGRSSSIALSNPLATPQRRAYFGRRFSIDTVQTFQQPESLPIRRILSRTKMKLEFRNKAERLSASCGSPQSHFGPSPSFKRSMDVEALSLFNTNSRFTSPRPMRGARSLTMLGKVSSEDLRRFITSSQGNITTQGTPHTFSFLIVCFPIRGRDIIVYKGCISCLSRIILCDFRLYKTTFDNMVEFTIM